MQEEVLCRLNEAVSRLDADVLRLAHRYPWAFPRAGSSVETLLASGRPIALEGGEHREAESAFGRLEAALKAFDASHGFSLLSYSAPSACLTAEGDLSTISMDVDDACLLFAGADGVVGGCAGEPVNGEGGEVGGLAGLLPLTATLLAARQAPLFNAAALTRQQVRDVLFLRRMQQRHSHCVTRTHAKLLQLVEQLQTLLDSTAFREQLQRRLSEVLEAEKEKRFEVSGEKEETVWQRWTAGGGSSSSKSRSQVVALSLANKQRLDMLLARWSRAQQRYAVLVEQANRVCCEVALQLNEELL